MRTYVVKGRATVYHKGRRLMLPPELADRADLDEIIARHAPAAGPSAARAYLASFDVVGERWANAIGAAMSFLVRPRTHFLLLAILFFLGIGLPLAADALGHIPTGKALDLGHASRVGLAAISIFLSISALLIFHEFGHAAACHSVGIRVDGMGVGFYLFMPSFYTKLSMVKLLTRRERIIVYTSGVYFQMMASVVLVLLAWGLQERVLLSLAHLNNFTVLLNLVPVARFDGSKILAEFSDWIERNDRFRLVRGLMIATTAAYVLYVARILLRNIHRLIEAAIHGQLTPTTAFFGLLSLIGVFFFVRSMFKIARLNLVRS